MPGFINYQISKQLIQFNRVENNFSMKEFPELEVSICFFYKQQSVFLLIFDIQILNGCIVEKAVLDFTYSDFGVNFFGKFRNNGVG